MADIPDLLRMISADERVLIVLRAGPADIRHLLSTIGLRQKQLWRVLDALRKRGQVKRLGVRNTTRWALSTHRDAAPPQRPLASVKRTPQPRTRAVSWWAVPPEKFEGAAKHRAITMGWDG